MDSDTDSVLRQMIELCMKNFNESNDVIELLDDNKKKNIRSTLLQGVRYLVTIPSTSSQAVMVSKALKTMLSRG